MLIQRVVGLSMILRRFFVMFDVSSVDDRDAHGKVRVMPRAVVFLE